MAGQLSPAEHFDVLAADWDANFEKLSWDRHRRRVRLSAALALIGPGPGRLLEVGCGSGHLLPPLLETGWDVHGVDPAPAMLERARGRAPEAADQLIPGTGEQLPYEPGSFDAVVAVGSLEYGDITRSVPEIARVLCTGGRAILALRNGRAPMATWRRHVVYPVARAVKSRTQIGRRPPLPRERALSPSRARALLADAGLQVHSAELVACEMIPDPLDVAAPRVAYRAARAAERFSLMRSIFGAQRMFLAVKEQPSATTS